LPGLIFRGVIAEEECLKRLTPARCPSGSRPPWRSSRRQPWHNLPSRSRSENRCFLNSGYLGVQQLLYWCL